MPVLQCGRFQLELGQPRIMAIINLTDDSFSGDGYSADTRSALARAERALEEGADMLDVGAESSRPGSDPVSEAQELERVVAFVDAARALGVPLSIDTVKPAVMRAALAAGAEGAHAPGDAAPPRASHAHAAAFLPDGRIATTDEASHPRRPRDNMPAVLGEEHADVDISGEELLRCDDASAALELGA